MYNTTYSSAKIMLRFRGHRITLVGNIEKAFLMVHKAEEDKNALLFLWIDDIDKAKPEIVVLRFTLLCLVGHGVQLC